jgi:hypothetical protein
MGLIFAFFFLVPVPYSWGHFFTSLLGYYLAG